MKVGGGGGKRPPEQPAPTTHTKHVRPHKAHNPKMMTGGFKTMRNKTRSASEIDPSQISEEMTADEIDELRKLQPAGESGQQGFSGQQKEQAGLPKLDKQPKQQEGVTLTEPHLHALLASI